MAKKKPKAAGEPQAEAPALSEIVPLMNDSYKSRPTTTGFPASAGRPGFLNDN